MKKIKLKFADRISISFIALFLFLMLFCSFFVINFLKFQDLSNTKTVYESKVSDINRFLSKIESFSNQYKSITLELTPKIENQVITYPEPFTAGSDRLTYIIRIRNSNNYDEIALNTLKPNDDNEKTIKLIKEFNNSIDENKINTHKPITYSKNGSTYLVVRLKKVISGNVFDIYIIKDNTNEATRYKLLMLLFLLYTLLGLTFIIFISNLITKKMLKPVNNIVKAASSISTKDLTIRIDRTGTGDELDNLITIINNMLERLNIAFDNQSKFISDVSHELRTPLAIIKGYAELVKRHGDTNDELINESVELIMNESINMKNLVDKLLFLAKGDANTVKINIETFDSVEFINQVQTDAMFFAKEHNIVIDKNQKYTLLADKSLLLQAIRTIIENGVKYSPKNSNIYISSTYDMVNKEAVISIKDEGIGIEEQYFEKIFDRFYRVDESRTKDTGGTGLGLSIVKKILAIHNGHVKVESKINEGSKFILYIPSKLKHNS